MAIQYYMRAFNTTLSKYVDWVVNDAPDSTGAFSGFPAIQLINITVNRVVQSKVSNFLKPNQSLGGTDGEFFHVNSYDWKNAIAPIPPPTVLTGFAVERGISAVTSITTATNASPIVVTSSTNHNLVSGQLVTISGVTGNTNTNGTWPIIVISPTTFSLTGSTGSGTYVSGGNIFTPSDFSTLIWDEPNNVWRLVFNTNGDGTTLGASQSLKVNNFITDGYIAIGPDPADTGAIRLSNNTYIFSEANPAGTDVQLIGADLLNRIKLGSLTTDVVYDPGVLIVDGYIQHDGTGSNTAQNTGFIREQNNTNIIAFRGAGALAGADIVALGSNATNNVVLGDNTNTGILYETSTGNLHQFQVNNNPIFEIGTSFARFPAAISAPLITQTVSGTGNGQTLTVQAQQGVPGASTGGILQLASGSFGVGGNTSGTVDIYTGAVSAANLKIRIFPTIASSAADNNSIKLFQNTVATQALIRIDSSQLNPLFRQDDQITNANGNSLTLQSQNATLGSPSAGGNMFLVTGKGNVAANDGYLFIQTGTGALSQIVVSPVNFPAMQYPTTSGKVVITGNLEVQGTTTTVDSTVVDIIGRVIHANWADPVTSPNVAVPPQVVGYSVHRGNSSGVPRDGAAILWTEGALNSGADGYWRHVTYPGDGVGSDNFTISNVLNAVGTMANDFAASSDPNPVPGALASTGSLRTANNVPAVVGRSNQASTTLTATGLTNGSATLPLGTITVVSTTGFSTPSGSLLIQSSAGPQTVTYTGTTGTSFTGVVGGTGTIVTGGIVAQTNASTTFTPAGPVSLPTGTITVASTTGFPASGTLRVVSHVNNTSTSPVSVQLVTYTGGGGAGTTFTGCTGGTGFLFAGDSISSPPVPGISDLVLLGTDFGNRILYGAPTNNTGHIFNTSTGFFYDFQVNSVSQVQLGQGEIDADGFLETIQIGPTVSNPRLVQQTLPNTGATNGFNLGVFAQSGQLQTGGNANNNGGLLILSSGAQGLGGAGAAGIDGYVELRTGFTSKVRVFPTVALSAGDNNSILYFENLFRVDTAQTNPIFRQDSTGNASGQIYTIQAQNALTTGGNLVLTSGTGVTAGNAQLQTGGVDRVVVHPTFTEFRDTAEALRITPVSAGTTQITYAATDTAAQINQTSTASTPSAPMTIQSQVTTAVSGVGGSLSLIAGNATNTTSTGGALNLASGSGTTTNGVINFQPGGTTQVLITATGQFIQWVSTMANPTLNQVTTGGASGTTLTVQAQNAATTGGNLVLTSGTGTTAGNVNLQTGAATRVSVNPTFTSFLDTAEALRITPVSAGTTQITYAATDTAAQINQTQTASTPSATMTIQSQVTTAASGQGGNLTLIAGNATGTTSTGGNAILTSGTGTTVAGNTILQTGGVNKVVVQPTFVTFMGSAAAEALRITPVSNGTTEILFAKGVTSAVIDQTAQDAGAGSNMTVHAQDGSTTGGNLILSSGSGTTNGVINFQTGLVTRLSLNDTTLAFATTVTAPTIKQSDNVTNGATAQTMFVQAQNATGTTSTGGDLILASGTGTLNNGFIRMRVAGNDVVEAITNQFVFGAGWARHVTSVSTTYQVLVSDDYIAATTSSAYAITMPSTPNTGDTYTIKDVSGGAGTNTLTISGNGKNIDGTASIVLNQAYAAVTLTYTGSQWSVT